MKFDNEFGFYKIEQRVIQTTQCPDNGKKQGTFQEILRIFVRIFLFINKCFVRADLDHDDEIYDQDLTVLYSKKLNPFNITQLQLSQVSLEKRQGERKGAQFSGQSLALRSQRIPVRFRLLAMRRGELPAVIAWLTMEMIGRSQRENLPLLLLPCEP